MKVVGEPHSGVAVGEIRLKGDVESAGTSDTHPGCRKGGGGERVRQS